MSRNKSLILLALAAIGFSIGGLFIKSVAWSPLAIAGTRSAIAAVVILLCIGKPRFTWSKPQLIGAFSYMATVICFVLATKLTTAANAILLQYTMPLFIAFFSYYFLRERVTRADWLTILVIFCGMVLFFFDNLNTHGMVGNLIAILAGASFASCTICIRMQKDSSPLETTLLGNLFTALVAVPFWFQGLPDAVSCFNLLILGVFQLGLPYVAYTLALKKVEALEASLVAVIEPVLNPLWVLVFVGEAPGIWAVIGGSIVLISSVGRCIYREKNG
ncbi:MAG: DMT family transporter [bacterium]